MSKDVLKVGDRIRLSTGVEAVVKELPVFHTGGIAYISFDGVSTPDRWLGHLVDIGVTWELVKPVLVEPPVGSVIQFDTEEFSGVIAERDGAGDWYTINASRALSWASLRNIYQFTEFDVLRPVQEVVKEVLSAVADATRCDRVEAVLNVADAYGVEL